MTRPIASCSAPPGFDVRLLDYDLPERLIAQTPAERREDARMMVVDRAREALHHARVRDLPSHLTAGDLLVLNDTRVLPARLCLRRATGGRVEGLFIEEQEPGRWTVMLRSAKRCKAGEVLEFVAPERVPWHIVLASKANGGLWEVRLSPATEAQTVLLRVGAAPLPPYIRRPMAGDESTRRADIERYQTVYARAAGAVAAPTAGLHLTEALLAQLGERGVQTAFVTLHVGLGTFKPIETGLLADHRTHAERFELPGETAAAIDACRSRGGRVVAVGTTTVRVLEHCAQADGTVRPQSGATDVFIYPPYTPRVVNALLTNFHLPRSTLLALVMAFAGIELTRRAYASAVESDYRFYSYGDAMLLL
ncbi:MAG: tRNA preQ1(34) S-adenosylmethionine ribosyltransferase-isomerase QueA [Phycisphaerales bacterium]|nr:MAG: tRNA preQ1(34) S-adenosylmethionine ribosyltransferase-isomerase QueA [Phycisphaerales bacterium]